MVRKKTNEEPEKTPKCRICNHEDRAGIEMVALMAAASPSIARTRINNTFGTNFTVETVKKHMQEHELHQAAADAGTILDSIVDETKPKITVENMLQTLLIQGVMDLAKGHIRCKTPGELIAVGNSLMNIQNKREQKMALESGDASGYYMAMAAYGEAIKDTVPPEQLGQIVMKANALGAHFNIGNIPLEASNVDIETIDETLSLAAKDWEELGRTRSREELIADGVMSEIDAELELPE